MSENEIEYEEFEVDEVKPEHIGLEIYWDGSWVVIKDVGTKCFFFRAWDGLTELDRKIHFARKLRRPKPKKKMVRFWRYKRREGQHTNRWQVTTYSYEDASEVYFNCNLKQTDAVEPFGEPFEE